MRERTMITRPCGNCGAPVARPTHGASMNKRTPSCSPVCLREMRSTRMRRLFAQPPWQERFWAKVRKTDGCWLWSGKPSRGYGLILVNGKSWFVHRLSYVIAHGSIPDGLFVCHHCDTPLCVNPAHLYAGTPQQNTDDMKARGREPDRRGEKNPSVRLTEADVWTIRARAAVTPRPTYAQLGSEYGVTDHAISEVVRRVSWGHVA